MRLGIVTDVHLCPPGTPPGAWHNPYDLESMPRRLTLALDRLVAEGVEAIAMLGDLTSSADADSVDRGLGILAETPLPIRVVPGNHDAEAGGVDLGERVAALDNRLLRMADPTGEIIGGVRVAGLGIEREREGWAVGPVSAVGWAAEPVVLLSHSPVLDIEPKVTAAGLKNAGSFADPTGVAALLAGRSGPTVVLHGHFHVRDAATSGPLLQLGFAALVEPPNEVAVLDIEPESGSGEPEILVSVRCLPIDPMPAERLPVLVPARQAWRFAAGSWQDIAADRASIRSADG